MPDTGELREFIPEEENASDTKPIDRRKRGLISGRFYTDKKKKEKETNIREWVLQHVSRDEKLRRNIIMPEASGGILLTAFNSYSKLPRCVRDGITPKLLKIMQQKIEPFYGPFKEDNDETDPSDTRTNKPVRFSIPSQAEIDKLILDTIFEANGFQKAIDTMVNFIDIQKHTDIAKQLRDQLIEWLEDNEVTLYVFLHTQEDTTSLIAKVQSEYQKALIQLQIEGYLKP